MIWLTWRQHRLQALAGAIGLAAIGGFFLLTHPGMVHSFRSSGLANCLANPSRDCGALSDAFDAKYRGLQFLIPLFLVVPLLVGLFWCAPLVARELEQGTHRLVWTQSVARGRWITTKLVLIGGGAVAGAAAFAALVTWWSAMFTQIHDSRFSPGIFDIRGVVPVAYVLFALILGVVAGTLIRRTLPAMAATLGGFIGVRALVTILARPHYLPAKVRSAPLLALGHGGLKLTGPPGSGAWVLSQVTLDRAGTVVSHGVGLDLNYMAARCPGAIPPAPAFPSTAKLEACIHRLGIHTVTTYQPGGRFWAFQRIEFGIYVLLAVALLAVAVWAVRRRIA